MEKLKLDNDIELFGVKANSFPDDIQAAHEQLSAVADQGKTRNRFGVSYMFDDKIVYMAAAEYSPATESIPDDCEPFTLKKGNYIGIYLPDFTSDISQIEKAFKILLSDPNIDENGCCVECYLPEGADLANAKDVRCMVRLADDNK